MDRTTQPSQANFGLVWLNRNFLWCQAAPLMGFVLMNLAISSRIGLFCFGGSTRKMSDNGSDTGNFTRASWVSYAKTVPLLVLIIFLLFQAMTILFVLAVPPRKWMIIVPTPGILPGPPGWESKTSLFIQNGNDGIKSTAYNQNW